MAAKSIEKNKPKTKGRSKGPILHSELDFVKRAFLEAYQVTFGNIAQSCKKVNVTRKTYYNWLEIDPVFKEAIDTMEPGEDFKDFIESKLTMLIARGNTAAVIFAAKTKCRDRGYVERQEIITQQGEIIDFREG